MPNQPPYLTCLRELLDGEISRPTPTRESILRLIEAIPQDNSHAHLPGLLSARESLESAIDEDLDRQRQRVGQEVAGLLKELMIPVAEHGKQAETSQRISTKEASARITTYLNRSKPEPQSRQAIASQAGLSSSATKRALALLINNGTVDVNKNARVYTYKIRTDNRPAQPQLQPIEQP